MVSLTVRGLGIRETDGRPAPGGILALLRQRQQLMGNAPLRIRAQDPVGDVSRLINQRQPLDLHITISDVIPEAQFQRVIRDSVVFAIPGTREIIEFVSHPELSFYVAKNVIAGSLRFGQQIAADIEAVSSKSELRIPTEAELLALNDVLSDQLEGMGRLIWTSTPNGDQERGESFILLRAGQSARFANSPAVSGPDYGIRFVKDK